MDMAHNNYIEECGSSSAEVAKSLVEVCVSVQTHMYQGGTIIYRLSTKSLEALVISSCTFLSLSLHILISLEVI